MKEHQIFLLRLKTHWIYSKLILNICGIKPQKEVAAYMIEDAFMPLYRQWLKDFGIEYEVSENETIAEDLGNDHITSDVVSSKPKNSVPVCDCGAVKAGTPHVDWCSLNDIQK